MKYQNQLAVKRLALKTGSFSERQFAKDTGISRTGLRNIMARDSNISLQSLTKVAKHLERDVHILATSDDTNSEVSTLAVAYKVSNQGFNSWKVHFMDLVDEFRRTLDPQLLLLAPPKGLDMRLKALLASMVVYLCEEADIDAPSWALKTYFLAEPWFVSETQSLKAMALTESPLAFRRNNIFVLSNFLTRL